MKIAIASDHGGFDLKEQLKEYYAGKGTKLDDLGTYSSESCDYPDIAKAMCDRILSGEAETGILICGTGIGISIAANRCRGIRAAILYSDEVAALARQHNNANIAVFGGRTMTFAEAARRMDIFLQTAFARITCRSSRSSCIAYSLSASIEITAPFLRSIERSPSCRSTL